MLFALGFVFMFTIGGLTIHLALSLKTTICWKLLTIMLLGIYLLNPVTMYNFEQSAGNQWTLFLESNVLVGISETRRGPRSLLREDIVRVIKNSLIPLKNSILIFTKPRFYSDLINHFDLDDKIRNLEESKPVKVYKTKNYI
jgi:hypothetical protein